MNPPIGSNVRGAVRRGRCFLWRGSRGLLRSARALLRSGPGLGGKGDGPSAVALNPKPFDLTVHGRLHTEGELFWWISNGIQGTGMPAFGALTELQRWQVVQYIRTLGLPAP